MKEWYKKLGYYQNPFLINPMKERTAIKGVEKQLSDATYYLKAGNLLLVEAAPGNGKTKLLRQIIEDFRGRVIYVNGRKLTKTLDIEELLRKKNGVSGKVFGKKPKGMILMVDNAEELSMVNIERLKNYFDQGYLHSVIFTTSNKKTCEFSESMINRIGRRVIKLEKPGLEDMQAIVTERLDEKPEEEDPLIEKEHIKAIHKKADSVSDMFVKLEYAFEQMDDADEDNISEDHYKELPSREDDTYQEIELKLSKEKRSLEHADQGKVMKVGSYYRDPTEEMFCSNCGAIVNEEDEECPECYATFEKDDSETDATKSESDDKNADEKRKEDDKSEQETSSSKK